MLRCDEEEIIAAVFPWDWIDVTRDTRVKERTVRVWQKKILSFKSSFWSLFNFTTMIGSSIPKGKVKFTFLTLAKEQGRPVC